MLSEKNTFSKKQYGFFTTLADPPPPGLAKDHKKYGFFFRNPSLRTINIYLREMRKVDWHILETLNDLCLWAGPVFPMIGHFYVSINRAMGGAACRVGRTACKKPKNSHF